MAGILAYGEDALTLWCLSSQLRTLLLLLGDSSDPEDAIVLYRPSFGRSSGRAEKERAAFGEFDAIVGTEKYVYLIEAKWEGSSEVDADGKIWLKPEQALRHQIFQWYRGEWLRLRPPDWSSFIKGMHSPFSGHKVADRRTRLAQNLQFVLGELDDCGTEIKNVLLFFFKEKQTAADIADANFTFVPFAWRPIQGSMHIALNIPNGEMSVAEGGPSTSKL